MYSSTHNSNDVITDECYILAVTRTGLENVCSAGRVYNNI